MSQPASVVKAALVRRMAGAHAVTDNIRSVVAGLVHGGAGAGLDRAHRLAIYVGQLGHESMGFAHDREVWGPSTAQRRYEGRRDLGNVRTGDGRRFKGRTAIQLTGRANYVAFSRWARERFPEAPDFEDQPERVNTDPWEGVAPIWYWDTRGLNRYADAGNHEMVTRRINGGLNGYADRLARTTRASLVLLGFDGADVRGFQAMSGLIVDGIAGPATRDALHGLLRVRAALALAEPEPGAPEPGALEPIPTPDDPAALIAEAIALLERAQALA